MTENLPGCDGYLADAEYLLGLVASCPRDDHDWNLRVAATSALASIADSLAVIAGKKERT